MGTATELRKKSYETNENNPSRDPETKRSKEWKERPEMLMS